MSALANTDSSDDVDGAETRLQHLLDHVGVDRRPERRPRTGRALKDDLKYFAHHARDKGDYHQQPEPMRKSLRGGQPFLFVSGNAAQCRKPDSKRKTRQPIASAIDA